MSPESEPTGTLQALLDRLSNGDEEAADELIAHAMDRLSRMTRKLLRDNPRVRRWEETDDVLQNSLVRLYRALKDAKPSTERHFINLAATQIQRELIDLARHHFGPHGDAAHHASDPNVPNGDEAMRARHELEPDDKTGPVTAMRYAEFHERASQLPEDEREVFKLIFYAGLEQAAVAKQLGISVPTVRRRWRSARLLMAEAMGGDAGSI